MTIKELIHHLQYLALTHSPDTEVYWIGDYGASMELQEGSVVYTKDRVEIG